MGDLTHQVQGCGGAGLPWEDLLHPREQRGGTGEGAPGQEDQHRQWSVGEGGPQRGGVGEPGIMGEKVSYAGTVPKQVQLCG